VEIIRPFSPRKIKIVVFDFDGTLSLLRTGWQQIMVDLMFETVRGVRTSEPRPRPAGNGFSDQNPLAHRPGSEFFHPFLNSNIESDAELRGGLREIVDQTTGWQSVDQMLMLAELVQSERAHQGSPGNKSLQKEALRYKSIYLDRLRRHMSARLETIEAGDTPGERFLVAGSLEFLLRLSSTDCRLCLISGTDKAEVIREAELLGIRRFFDNGIFGGLNETRAFTKQEAMHRVLSNFGIHSRAMVAFGDGIIDIQSTREIGALAVGVASNEEQRYGINSVKRSQLIAAGADAVIGDYTGYRDWFGKIFDV
jgi:phosphoglycolate phosphatase-like HAD superfamily hydrolase